MTDAIRSYPLEKKAARQFFDCTEDFSRSRVSQTPGKSSTSKLMFKTTSTSFFKSTAVRRADSENDAAQAN